MVSFFESGWECSEYLWEWVGAVKVTLEAAGRGQSIFVSGLEWSEELQEQVGMI